MSKRVTILLDHDLDKKLRLLQAKELAKSMESVSFSRTLNDVLRKGLK